MDGDFREGPGVVRQRVGLLEPLRRSPQLASCDDGEIFDSRLAQSPGGACSSASISTSRSRTGRSPTTRGSWRLSRPSRYALEQGATVVLASHLGRPKGKPTPEFSLKPVAARLGRAPRARCRRWRTIASATPAQGAVAAAHGEARSKVALLENLRFHPEEEKNDPRLRESARRARRRLCQRRLWRGAPRARVGGRDRAAVRRGRRRPADGKRAALSRHGHRGPGAAVRQHPRRRQGVGQDRGHREPRSARSIAF